MKKPLLFILFLVSSLFPPVYAQEGEPEPEQIIGPPPAPLMPVIAAQEVIQVDRNIIFDASASVVATGEEVEPAQYVWDFGDGTVREDDQEVVHTYQEPGFYEVSLTLRQGDREETAVHQVFAYQRLLFLVTNLGEKQEHIERLREDAQKEGTYIFLVESYDSTTAYVAEEDLLKKLREETSALANAQALIMWTERSSGINALTRLAQESPAQKSVLGGKDIVVITDGRLNTAARIMQGNFNIIQPRRIIITRQSEMRNLLAADSIDEFVQGLESSLSDYKVLSQETGRVSLWNFISYLVSFMIGQGIPSNSVILLLMLPVIVTLISFMRQVIGITTFGLYTPAIVTLSFLAMGLEFGLLILFIIIAAGALVRKALNRFRLMHIPRVAIILTLSTLIILLTLALGTYLGISSIATVAVFPMLIMTTLAEKFATALTGQGFASALILMLETTFVSLLCYWVAEWPSLQNLMLAYPEIILLLLLLNYGLGRWSGLRLIEYIRFREVMQRADK